MNVNLAERTDQLDTSRTVEQRIDQHRAVINANGYDLTGRTALIATDPDRPGSYQVWHEFEYTLPDTRNNPGDHGTEWVWVDEEGVARISECPLEVEPERA